MNRITSPQSEFTCRWGLTPRCVKTGAVALFETGKCCIPCNRVRVQMAQNRFQAKKRARNAPPIDSLHWVAPRIKTIRVQKKLSDEEILADTINLLAGNL